jgi:heptosyltransferase-3
MARMELARFAVGRLGISRALSIDSAEIAHLLENPDTYPDSVRKLFGGFDHVYSFFAADDRRFRRSLTAVAPAASFYPFRPSADGHVAAAYLAAVYPEAPAPDRAAITLRAEDTAAASDMLARLGLQTGSFLLILPGSGSVAKNWAVENFLALAKLIQPELRSLCVLGPAESDLESRFKSAQISTVSSVELGVVAGIAALSRLFVGNDSGVSHLAAAAGASGVVIFGPTDPARWRPLGRVEAIRSESIANIAVEDVAALVVDSRGSDSLPIRLWGG